MRRQDGFTLVEMLVVIFIIMLVAGFTGIGMSYYRDRNVLKKAELFASEVKLARDMQIEKANKKVFIEFEDKADGFFANRKISKRDGSDEKVLNTYKVSAEDFNKYDDIVSAGGSITLSPTVPVKVSSGDKIEFSSTTGKVLGDGFGVYEFSFGSKKVYVKIQEENGRVIVYE